MSSVSFPYKDHPEPSWSESEAENVEILFKWIQELPVQQNFTKNHAQLFLHSCYFNMENAKKAFKKYCDIRSNYVNVFGNRDPMLPEIQKSLSIINMVKLPHETKEGYGIVIYKLIDSDPSKCEHVPCLKSIGMFADMVLSRSRLVEGYVLIIDMKCMVLGHIPCINLSILKMSLQYFQEAHPYRLKKVYIVNVPPFISKIMMILKPLLLSEVFSLIDFLPGGPKDHLPAELLPQDYEGQLPSIEELYKSERKCIEIEYRDWLIASSSIKAPKGGKSRLSSSCSSNIEFD